MQLPRKPPVSYNAGQSELEETMGDLQVQDPHALEGARENRLEVAIGHQVREFRMKLGMTVADLGRQAGLSAGMMSKIENGVTSP